MIGGGLVTGVTGVTGVIGVIGVIVVLVIWRFCVVFGAAVRRQELRLPVGAG